MPNPMMPPLHSGTHEPIGLECHEMTQDEVDAAIAKIDTPKIVDVAARLTG